MSEVTELYADLRLASQKKRAANREASPKLLEAAHIPFEIKNAGAHLIVKVEGLPVIDFWPGTGKWIVRGSNTAERGVRRLILYIQRPKP